jgi:hypothetical protein
VLAAAEGALLRGFQIAGPVPAPAADRALLRGHLAGELTLALEVSATSSPPSMVRIGPAMAHAALRSGLATPTA